MANLTSFQCISFSLNLKLSNICGNLALLFVAITVAAENQNTSMPITTQRTLVSISYDDALPSQLQHAVPALQHYGLKATFYLNLAAQGYQQHKEQWQALAKAGHELGNHSIRHACRASLVNREWVLPGQDLDKLTVAQLKAEISAANAELQALDGQAIRTFTPPCGDSTALDGNYLTEVAPLFSAVKGPADLQPQLQHLTRAVLFIPTWFPVEPTLAELIAYLEQAERNNSVASISFHGVGGDHLQVDAKIHQQFLAYLAANSKRFQVDTALNISRQLALR
jgi:peptidoglycan/xylan/chitin deacetylase (PgdA/CDA1 family)